MELLKITKSYERKQKLYKTKQNNLKNQIENAEQIVRALELAKSKMAYPHQHENYMELIAKELLAYFKNRTYKIFGPFGLACESSIHFYKNGVTKDNKHEGNNCISVTFRLSSDENGNNVLVLLDRLKDSKKYEKGSIGESNGMNYSTVEMPETIEDLVKFIKKQNRKPRKKK